VQLQNDAPAGQREREGVEGERRGALGGVAAQRHAQARHLSGFSVGVLVGFWGVWVVAWGR